MVDILTKQTSNQKFSFKWNLRWRCWGSKKDL